MIVHLIKQIDDIFHVVFLVAEEHRRRKRYVAANCDIVFVCNFLGLCDVYVLVYRYAVWCRFAHDLYLFGRVAADEER